ncbi:MAG: signal peptidase I [Lachnospiraceae bacterium]|nr:signal peptidase I [Lachnospiraceae bacterium]
MPRRNKGLSFYTKRKKLSATAIREIASWVFLLILAFLIAYVFVFSVGHKTSVIGDSMEPALVNGEEVLINRLVYSVSDPGRGDVIVFLPNGNQNTHYYVKRVIGLPGEYIQIEGGHVLINGTLLEEDETLDLMEDGGIAENGLKLGEHEYFVLGDNRNNSEDSRSANIGVVSEDNIIGEAWFHLGTSEHTLGLIE